MRRWLVGFLLNLLTVCTAAASQYYGQVTFGGLPAPGATVTATHGTKHFSVTSDDGGLFQFKDLDDGPWAIDIKMQCFEPLHGDVTVAPNLPAAKWELKLLSLDGLKAIAKPGIVRVLPQPATQTEGAKKAEAKAAEVPRAPQDSGQDSSDGLLVNGSVNNAATSPFSMSQAFGNRRSNSRSLYNGALSLILANSALDARPYSLSGFLSPKPDYSRISGTIAVGGPIKIPHLIANGPYFFLAYQGARNSSAATDSGLVPEVGTTATDPAAQALLGLYPQPNVTGNPLYNFQIPVLDSTHQDGVQARLNKYYKRNSLSGGFNLQSSRSDNVNLFGFVDNTATLGANANVDWSRYFAHRISIRTSYRFTRMRSEVQTEFQNRKNIAGDAGIGGDNQDPANWGPPTLVFTSGMASLNDGNSSFNRNRTDQFTAAISQFNRRHNITAGGDLRKQQYNDSFQQNPRGTFTFTGAATGSALSDFLAGIPDTSSVAFGNADKYIRQTVFDAYATDDWRLLPELTINAGVRWEYAAPMTELHGRLVNLDIADGFTAVAPVLGSNPVGKLTSTHYPAALVNPDKSGVEPRIGLSWRPIPASTVVVRAGYGIYHDTSVYLRSTMQLAQQAPLSTSVNEQNSAACPLTLENGFTSCAGTTSDSYALDPHFRVGYAQSWQLSVQRDLPWSLQTVVSYLGVKGTHGVQEFLPNSYPLGGADPCPSCPSGFVYETSGGNSTRQSGQLQLRRRLRAGLAASLLYTYSKSLDDDALLGGQGGSSNASQSGAGATVAGGNAAIAQDWRNVRAERSLSSFDQRQVLNFQTQYTTGQGLEGGTLLHGWPGRVLKEWTVLTQIGTGSGLPETPSYPAAVPGTGWIGPLRPTLTGAPLYAGSGGAHLNAAAYAAPTTGEWGDAGRNSIAGPATFNLDGALQRTFRPWGRYNFDARVDANNLLNHAVYAGWNTSVGNTQFGQPLSVNAMRSLQTTLRLRF